MFCLFAAGVLVIYLLFLGLTATSTSPGLRNSPTVYAALTIAVALLGVWGWFLTVHRAPRQAVLRDDALVVTERSGRARRFSPLGVRVRVLYRYGPGLLAAEPTELVELSDAEGRRRNYLVGRGFFQSMVGPSDPAGP